MATHILIIEDNEMSLALADYLLRQSGYVTSTATDGGSGVRLALENRADLILCDLDLPVIDGQQVVNTLRAAPDWRPVPILAFTAASLSQEQRQILAADFAGCILKPINPASFTGTIAQYLPPEPQTSHG